MIEGGFRVLSECFLVCNDMHIARAELHGIHCYEERSNVPDSSFLDCVFSK